jgi:uncharacterized protein (DUF2147 family)
MFISLKKIIKDMITESPLKNKLSVFDPKSDKSYKRRKTFKKLITNLFGLLPKENAL